MGQQQIWQTIQETNGFYQLSNDGRVRKIDKNLMKYGIHIYKSKVFEIVNYEFVKRKYLKRHISVPYIRIKYKDQVTRMIPISTMMYKEFYGVSNIQVDEIIHIDGREDNNNLSNLILGTKAVKLEYLSIYNSEQTHPNIIKLRENVSSSYCEKISKYDMNGNLFKVYANVRKASLGEGVSVAILMKCLQRHDISSLHGNYYFKGHGPELLDFSIMENQKVSIPKFRNQKRKSIFLRYSIDGSLKAVYSTLEEASNQTFCAKSKIKLSIKTRSCVDNSLWVQLYEGSLFDSEDKKESFALH